MAFVIIPGFEGKVYVPDKDINIKKHDCRDCFICQMCNDEKCNACLASHCSKKKQNDKSEQ